MTQLPHHVEPSEEQRDRVEVLKACEKRILEVLSTVPGRSASIAITNTETAIMWAVRAAVGK